MKLLNIKKIAFASALVAGNTLMINVSAQTNLITSLNPTSGTVSGLSITSEPLFPGSGTQQLSLTTNLFTINPGSSYTLSFNLSRAITGTVNNGQAIFLRPNPSLVVSNSSAVSSLPSGLNTYQLSAATLANRTGPQDFLMILRNGSGEVFTLSSLMLIDDSAPPAQSGPSAADTQSAVGLSASRLKGIYNLQSVAVVNGLTYDCKLFDKNNICLSTGGRYSNNHGAAGYSTSALLIGGYRIDKNIRVGAWVDQNLSTNSATGTSLSNSKPLFGVFGAWAENPSGEGYEVKVSAGYGDKDLTVTRDVIGTSEAGFGSTRLNSQAISTVSSYGFKLNNDVLASPYVGVQYSRLASSGYTEASTADVTAPLTYGRLSQENVSILAGLKLSARLDPKTALFGSVGVEQNVNNKSGQYSATGVDGLTAVDFNSNVQKTRATASAGVSYDIDKKQRVSLSGIYREEAFNPTATTSVFATYTVGL